MVESDDEYIQDASDDDVGAHQVTKGTKSGPRGPATRGGGGVDFEVTRTWESIVEGKDGTIKSTVEGLLEAGKRRRLLKDTTPLQRGIIRYLVLILDFSFAMAEKDLRPTRYLLTIRYAMEFVHEYFEQNPISQLGILGMKDGLVVRVSDMSGNPNDHITGLQTLRTQEPGGNASLQNALDMARGSLFHAPSHGTREILLVFGSLLSSDPGDIHTTITALQTSHVTVSVIGLAAQIAICATLVARTNPGINPAELYGVALNEQHFRDLFMRGTTPPVTAKKKPAEDGTADSTMEEGPSAQSSLLMMGFPSRLASSSKSFCACHSKPTRGGYLCSRCSSKVCSLPSACPACGLTLILSTHLARSYHHLFPLRNWQEVSWARARQDPQETCFSCMTRFPNVPRKELLRERKRAEAERGRVPARRAKEGGASESGRYVCTSCGRFFCVDCDVFAHEVVHNCPGCLSQEEKHVEEGGMEGNEAVGMELEGRDIEDAREWEGSEEVRRLGEISRRNGKARSDG